MSVSSFVQWRLQAISVGGREGRSFAGGTEVWGSEVPSLGPGTEPRVSSLRSPPRLRHNHRLRGNATLL